MCQQESGISRRPAVSPLSEALGFSVLKCGHGLVQQDVSPGPHGPASRQIVTLPGSGGPSRFQNQRLRDWGMRTPVVCRVSSTTRAKTRKLCYIHLPAQSQKQPAGLYFQSLIFRLMESVK